MTRRLLIGSFRGVSALRAGASLRSRSPVFRSGVDLVTMGVTVTDKKGNLVTDLTREDFEILEDGRKQTISEFASEDQAGGPPMHLGLMLDISESMDEDMKFTKTAAMKFLNTLLDAVDVTVVDFDTEVRLARYGQNDFARLIERIRQRKATGWTALYDAIGVYLDGAAGQDGRKIMLLYTDGGDTRSSTSFHELVDLLKASDVTVYAIGELEHLSSSGALEARVVLQQIAETTGGQAFFPVSVKQLDEVYEKVLARDPSAIHDRLPVHQREEGRRLAQGSRSKSRARMGANTGSARARATSRHSGSPRRATGWPRPLVRLRVRMPSVYDRFNLVSDFTLAGDQERAIGELVDGLERGDPHQVLLGVTGSGKTFTMAQTIARVNRPTLVMVHNKTLAAQLFQEFRRFFPDNAVEYFVSYYDYYQPEAYVPATDSYIEKEATINDEIDRMRLSATRSLFERRDVIIVASVSCIYGLGSPEAYYGMLLPLERGQRIGREQVLRKLVEIQYERNDHDFGRGTFRVRGDIIEVIPSYEEQGLRIELFGDEVDELTSFDPLTGKSIRKHDKIAVYPKSHFVAPRDRTKQAVETIKEELVWRRGVLEAEGRLLEAQRLHQRTMFDLEMIREIGYCHGIENYARHLTGRAPGEPPPTLLDYLPKDALIIVDESHQTVPQVRGMYHGDRSRKEVLVAYGFRLPSALDNRPLNFEEWEERVGQVVFVSATPGSVRAVQVARRRRRADHPADRPDRSADRHPAGERPGGRPAAGDPRPRGARANGCW